MEEISLIEGATLETHVSPHTMQTLDSLHAFYHRQWWCYTYMYRRFKYEHAILNVLALLLLAAGIVEVHLSEREFDRQHLGCLRHPRQRVERFQKVCRQDRHVPLCLHHVRENLRRTEKLRTRRRVWRSSLSPQNGHPRRYHYWSHTTRRREMHQTLQQKLLLSLDRPRWRRRPSRRKKEI